VPFNACAGVSPYPSSSSVTSNRYSLCVVETFSHLGLLCCLILLNCRFLRVESASYSSISSLSSDQLSSKYFLVKPSDVYVIEGESAELKCQISADSDAGPVQWSKDGFLLGECSIQINYRCLESQADWTVCLAGEQLVTGLARQYAYV